MGNNDGIMEVLSVLSNNGRTIKRTNKVINFDGGYFSFAFKNEIALVLDKEYFILNCNSKLFDEVKEKVNSGMSKTDLISFWFEKSKEYKISIWSANFNKLKGVK
jgi:hypothetical protein